MGLLLKAVQEHKITLQNIVTMLYHNPQQLFNIPKQEDTFLEIDLERTFLVGENGYESKCGWSPFEGWELPGLLQRVVLRGKTLYSLDSAPTLHTHNKRSASGE